MKARFLVVKTGLLLWLFACLVHCKQKTPEINGFGPYQLGKTKSSEAGRCRPDGEYNYCFLNASSSLAGHKTVTDLYFLGLGENDPLVEILVTVNMCKEDVVANNLVSRLGQPTETHSGVLVWKQTSANVVLQKNVKGGTCEMNILALSEEKRLKQLTKL